MIVKSTWRQAGGFQRHLERNDTNEAVRFLADLSCGSDLHDSLALLAGLSRTNPKCKRAFIHVIISPDHALTIDDLRQTLGLIAAEHGIAGDASRAVVQHDKGLRPAHFHVAYSVVDTASGRAIKSHGNHERDELISRLLEIRFGERIIPGPHLRKNIAVLKARGMNGEVDLLSRYQPHRNDDPLDRHTRQQASRLGIDPVTWSATISRLFDEAGRSADAFARKLPVSGLSIARGDRATLIVDDATGHHESLVRLLRREAKKKGRWLRLNDEDIRDAFPDAKPFVAVRDEGLARAQDRARTAVDLEWSRLLDEAAIDADRALTTYRAERKREAAEAEARDRAWFSATLKTRREAIVAAYRERDRIRRERVDRVFRIARILDTAQARRTTFALAATGLLLAGAGLAATIAGAGFAVAMMPTLNRARANARRASEARTEDAVSRRTDLARSYADVRLTNPRTSRERRPRFNFNDVPKSDRILAGAVALAIVSGRPLAEQPAASRAAMALGPALVDGITHVLACGSILQARRLLNWGGPAPSRNRAIAAALRRHAAAVPAPEPTRPPTDAIPAKVSVEQEHSRPKLASGDRGPQPAVGPKPAGIQPRSAGRPAQNRRIIADAPDILSSGFSTPETRIKPSQGLRRRALLPKLHLRPTRTNPLQVSHEARWINRAGPVQPRINDPRVRAPGRDAAMAARSVIDPCSAAVIAAIGRDSLEMYVVVTSVRTQVVERHSDLGSPMNGDDERAG